VNQVIKELYDMEAQAGKIMENAGLSKQKLQEQKKRQMEDINIGIAAELEGRMSILRAQLEEQAKEDIRQLVEQNRQQIDLLDAEYRDNLTTYAQEIVRKITEI
jgi:hypothetical protein